MYSCVVMCMANYFCSVESSDSNGAGSVIAVAVLAVLFTVALICCLGLIVIVFKLHRKIIFLEEKIK